MLTVPVPDSPGAPVLWWLFWFVVSSGVYLLVILWFWRTLKRETRDPAKAAPRAAHE
jgi:hypothetical protein